MKTIYTVEATSLAVSKKKGMLRWMFAAALVIVQSQTVFGQSILGTPTTIDGSPDDIARDTWVQAKIRIAGGDYRYHMIGIYPGWDPNAVYLGGYNMSNRIGEPVNKVVVGGYGSALPLIVTGGISGQSLLVNNGGVSTLNVYGSWGGSPTEPVAKIVATDGGVGESGVAFNRKIGALDFELLNVHYQGTSRLLVHSNGNVLIGKARPSNWVYLLDVNGSMRANEVVVNTTGADFVFDEGYKLMPLPEVESFIKANHHLPEMASAKQMQEEGAGVGEMQTKLLQKVEELTLHLIEQGKTLEAQNKRLLELERENQVLKQKK